MNLTTTPLLMLIGILFLAALLADRRHALRVRADGRGMARERPFKCLKGNCHNGYGEARFVNGNLYRGQYRKGRKHGRGTFIWRDGRMYDGQWRDGRMNGPGVMTFPLGGRFEGNFVEDRKEGRGRYTWPNGGVYEGEFKNDKRHGPGAYTDPEGRTLRCLWCEDRPVTPS
ncbi:MAG: hypothetical protein HQL82_00930 [Magnetococcales bacterium]|nr:hypothetical protein [Magnetococcales bacterium]